MAQREANGQRTELRKRPVLLAGAEWLFTAFSILSSRRADGAFGPSQPISIEAIEAYARLRRLSDDDVDDLLVAVERLDDVYRKHQESKLEQTRAQAPRASQHSRELRSE